MPNLILKLEKKSKLAELFEGFDYEKYCADWKKKNGGHSKEIDWGKPVGKEIK